MCFGSSNVLKRFPPLKKKIYNIIYIFIIIKALRESGTPAHFLTCCDSLFRFFGPFLFV